MQLFHRKKSIDIDLQKLTMQEIMYFSKKEEVSLEEYYLKELFSENHIQIGVVQGKSYSSGIHDFKYDINLKIIEIYSRFRKSAFFIFSVALMPLLPIVLGGDIEDIWPKLLGLTILTIVAISLMLILTIKSESKTIEREMNIRINYLRSSSEKG